MVVVGWRTRLQQRIERARSDVFAAAGWSVVDDDADQVPAFGGGKDRRTRAAFARDFGLERDQARGELARLKRERKCRELAERTPEQRVAAAAYQRAWYARLKSDPARYGDFLQLRRESSARWRNKDPDRTRTLKREQQRRRRDDRNARRRAARLADPAAARERDRIENGRRLLKAKQRDQVDATIHVLAEERERRSFVRESTPLPLSCSG